MTQRSKVAVVLAVVVIVFVAVTVVGFRGSANPETMKEDEKRRYEPPNWLRGVGNWLPSPMPSIDLSAVEVEGHDDGTLVGVLVQKDPKDPAVTIEVVFKVCVRIKVRRSEKDFRQTDLYLVEDPPVSPVSVNVTEPGTDPGDPKDWQKLESDDAGGRSKGRMRVVISGKGGTITLRQDRPAEGVVSRVRFK